MYKIADYLIDTDNKNSMRWFKFSIFLAISLAISIYLNITSEYHILQDDVRLRDIAGCSSSIILGGILLFTGAYSQVVGSPVPTLFGMLFSMAIHVASVNANYLETNQALANIEHAHCQANNSVTCSAINVVHNTPYLYFLITPVVLTNRF